MTRQEFLKLTTLAGGFTLFGLGSLTGYTEAKEEYDIKIFSRESPTRSGLIEMAGQMWKNGDLYSTTVIVVPVGKEQHGQEQIELLLKKL